MSNRINPGGNGSACKGMIDTCPVGEGFSCSSFCYTRVNSVTSRGGQVYGSSDRGTANPSTNTVGPADLAATIFLLLGIDPRADITDQQGRPFIASSGSPIKEILA